MGKTYKARDTRLDKHFALKVMSKGWQAAIAEKRRFFTEAKLASKIEHPNVVRIVHVSAPDAVEFFYAMEFIEGESFEERLRRTGPMPAGEALDLLRAVADALTSLTEPGLVHRDIKPANIMIAARTGPFASRVKLIDFGLVKSLAGNGEHLSAHLTGPGVLGTVARGMGRHPRRHRHADRGGI